MTTPTFLHAYAPPARAAADYVRIVSGKGATVTDDHGKQYVDALGSLWYCQVGHGRDEIVDAITAQLRKIAGYHTFDRFTNAPADELCDRVARLTPIPDARVFLTSGGSESVDTALKLARITHFLNGDTKRTLIVSREPSYHGVSYGAMTATGLPMNRQGFGPLVEDIVQVPYDDLAALDAIIAERGDQLAAVIAEPIVGAGGVLPPPDGYLEGLRERCDRAGALLILDEVICGFGRLGTWFGAQRYGVTPDLMTFAKGVTSGYQPVGGVVVGARVRAALESDPAFVLRHGHTYSGHPAGCAAGLANLDILERESLAERAPKIGKRLGDGLRQLVDSGALVGARGEAGMWAAVLPDGVDPSAVRDRMLERGVIPRPLGANALAFCPPLVISDDQLDQCLDALGQSISA
ncbi:MAG TPA: aminotransferase class III-fold pyridoxal phosphate-dependent enzyme [Acidimicrobiales bacterium]|nr:aminotransferase class III-fold pyridoxal phosphate-dependent enzyme [Acidimicrobiales bacterium]